MGRPSKLSPEQWAEIERRLVAGDGVRALAGEYGISPGQVSKRFPNSVAKSVQAVAEKVAEAQTALATLPVPHQAIAMSWADELRGMSVDIIGAGRFAAKNAYRLNALANSELQKIDDADPMASQDALKGVAVLTKMANDAAATPIALLSANKDRVQKLDDAPDADAAPTSGVLKVPGMSMTAVAWSAAVTGKDQPTENRE